ncbi:MAG TPA: SGNH/GDSL hydrolase family protein [Luteibaculaceae bacterium]|nr:SGNH/GDSL hydrolase family protein [Luteibaculaceae bacterium]
MKATVLSFLWAVWSTTTVVAQVATYLPLGDSYTIGEGVDEADRFPNQLVQEFKQSEFQLRLLGNWACTGCTSQQLLQAQLPHFFELKPNWVTLCIGVNDYVQGVDIDVFIRRFQQILDTITDAPWKPKLIVLTIPDFGVTPAGSRYGKPAVIHQELEIWNRAIQIQAQKRKIPVIDLFEWSQQMKDIPSLVHTDKLHPSAIAYASWAKFIQHTIWTHYGNH